MDKKLKELQSSVECWEEALKSSEEDETKKSKQVALVMTLTLGLWLGFPLSDYFHGQEAVGVFIFVAVSVYLITYYLSMKFKDNRKLNSNFNKRALEDARQELRAYLLEKENKQ